MAPSGSWLTQCFCLMTLAKRILSLSQYSYLKVPWRQLGPAKIVYLTLKQSCGQGNRKPLQGCITYSSLAGRGKPYPQ